MTKERLGFWMENAFSTPPNYSPTPPNWKPAHILLDVGYLRDPAAQERLLAVIACVGKSHKRRRNAEIAGFGRVLIRIPEDKLPILLQQYPEIQEGGGYVWVTHSAPFCNRSVLGAARRAVRPAGLLLNGSPRERQRRPRRRA